MKIKIRESKQENGLNGYLMKIVEAREALRKYFGLRASQVVSNVEAQDFAKIRYGDTWYYNPTLDLILDARQDALNRGLQVDKATDTLIANVESITTVYPVPNVNTNSTFDPEFKGQWGTPIQSDRTMHNFTQSAGNATVLTGSSAANYQMRSGYPIADVGHSPEVTALTPFSEKQKVIKIKL